ncbi:Glucoamylase [Zancudomyces culisetae]|uniref:glucan 1,4-alpha-glucosidase n=1 Tax=Zancudomyces culisetae TaxID=1213189 RepID=A0A1R1PMN1_ZANCU|nr:Glucoamylase [Zancudomyces culisetae]|eukprot:OMH82209.1 Glucoamylase [Zancudomyces culisetae]
MLGSLNRSILPALLLSSAAYALTKRSDGDVGFDEWVDTQYKAAVTRLNSNLHVYESEPDVFKGAMVASPSKKNPDYFYHWTRDSALTMSCVVDYIKDTANAGYNTCNDPYSVGKTANDFDEFINYYINFTNFLVKYRRHPVSDLGEPKFYMNGTLFLDPWGRPQNDGPAERSITNIQYFNLLMSTNNFRSQQVDGVDFLNNVLMCDSCVLTQDLKYLEANYTQPNFDVWEEVSGTHFYNMIATSKAFKLASQLYDEVYDNQPMASKYEILYRKTLDFASTGFWNSTSQILMSTIDYKEGVYKTYDFLDATVVLAWIHTFEDGDFFIKSNDMLSKTLQTVKRLIEVNSEIYTVNDPSFGAPGIAIGRYPSDKYNGYDSFTLGNPWLLLTSGVSEFFYKFSISAETRGKFIYNSQMRDFLLFSHNLLQAGSHDKVISSDLLNFINAPCDKTTILYQSKHSEIFNGIQSLLAKTGDFFLKRVQFHSLPDGSMAEQFNRETGKQQGAPDLTWSYAAFMTAVNARSRALSAIQN